MKLVRHGNRSLRISLTPQDLEEFQVSLEDFDYELPQGKRVLLSLFDKAKEETGFCAEEEKLYVQLYPKRDGGCELFIICLEADEEPECFAFDSFDSFLTAHALFCDGRDATCYGLRGGKRFLILAPSHSVPPRLWEYGEKMKHPPSPLFLRARCTRLSL